MTIAISDVKFRKPVTITDTGVNGGRKSSVQRLTNVRHSLFPRVTKAERTAGVTRYRKDFWCNENALDEIAYDVLLYIEFPSNGGDRFYIGRGTQSDIQSEMLLDPPIWGGCGKLNSSLVGGEGSVDLLMEADDFEFRNGGILHLSDKFKTGQTVDSDVQIGDSVTYSGGTWSKIASTTDIIYPNGVYVGSNVVMTNETGVSNEEFLTIAENLTTDEDIGNGNGSSTSPALTDLANVTNGLVGKAGFQPVITATCGGTQRTVTIDENGDCSGYCSAGQINMDTGVWITDITWTTAPDNATDILATYYDKPYSYSGNVATVELESGVTVANAYSSTNTYGADCVENDDDEVKPLVSNWNENSVSGTYDETSYPLALNNDGAEEDQWTITFTSATAFTVSGLYAGSVGTGSISADFIPINPNTGQPFFTLLSAGWGGTWANGETLQFRTHPAALPVWWKEIVPAATAAENNNLSIMGWYAE